MEFLQMKKNKILSLLLAMGLSSSVYAYNVKITDHTSRYFHCTITAQDGSLIPSNAKANLTMTNVSVESVGDSSTHDVLVSDINAAYFATNLTKRAFPSYKDGSIEVSYGEGKVNCQYEQSNRLLYTPGIGKISN